MAIKSVLMDQSNKMLFTLRVAAIAEEVKDKPLHRKTLNESARSRDKAPSVVKFSCHIKSKLIIISIKS